MAYLNYSRSAGFKIFFCFCSLLFAVFTSAQDKLPGHAIHLIGGYSIHGSGDFKGIVFGTEYTNYLSKRWSITYNIRGTIHDGQEKIIINNLITGTRTDASVRFTTGGVQLGLNGGFSIVRNHQHELMISLGVFGRYQSASNGDDGYSVYFPSQTGQPTVLIGYDNKTPARTGALGGIFQLQYNYTFKNNIYIGLLPGFQTDTHGDAIPYVALTVGKRLF